MALTPEDVVNKRFQPTKFREGYDQDEVDDFLDEVVTELRRLTSENDDLRQKLSSCEQRVSELSRGGSAQPASAAAEADTAEKSEAAAEASPATGEHAASDEQPDSAANASVDVEAAADESATGESSDGAADDDAENADAQPDAVPAGDASQAAPSTLAAAADGGTADATGLITLAQRLHDEHVQKGEEKRDQLISEAETKASELVEEAEKKRADTLSSLEEEKSMLDRKIDRLRDFERQYRTRLKSYLQDQLRDLESRASLVPDEMGEGQQP